LRWHGIWHGGLDRQKAAPALPFARDLRVHVNTSCAEGCVVGFDVFGLERAIGLVAPS
jgi:hypothetical protein